MSEKTDNILKGFQKTKDQNAVTIEQGKFLIDGFDGVDKPEILPFTKKDIEDAKKHALELYEMYDFDDEQITEIYSRIQGRKTISKKLEALKQHHLEYSNPKYIEVIEIHPAPFHKAKKK